MQHLEHKARAEEMSERHSHTPSPAPPCQAFSVWDSLKPQLLRKEQRLREFKDTQSGTGMVTCPQKGLGRRLLMGQELGRSDPRAPVLCRAPLSPAEHSGGRGAVGCG